MSGERGPVYKFFSIYGNNFTKLTAVNFMFLVLNIPSMFACIFLTLRFLPKLNSVFEPGNFAAFMADAGYEVNGQVTAGGTDFVSQLYYIIVMFCVMLLMGSLLVCIGPFQAGFSQIYRNLYRGDMIYPLQDFKKGVKNNLVQSLASTVISIVVTFVCLLAISFYGQAGTKFGTVVSVLFTVILFSFTAIQHIVYQLMVTVDLPLSKLYRNAVFFFLMRFIQYAVMAVSIVLILFLLPFVFISSFTYFGYGLAILYYLTFAFAFCHFMLAYYSAGMIDTYIVKKIRASEENDEASDDENSEADKESDDDEDDDDEEEPDDDSDDEDESDDDDQEEDTEEEG